MNERHLPPKSSPWVPLGIAACFLVMIGVVAYLWLQPSRLPEPPPPQPVPDAVAPAPVVEPPAEPASVAIEHPLEVPASSPKPVAAPDIGSALAELFGRKAVDSLLQTDNFTNKFVATVDNLGRARAPTMMWPANRTPGRFSVEQGPSGAVIGAANAARYAPFVQMIEKMDSARAVDLYVRMYPQFQQAYEQLGLRGYFNDRLVAVIDQLLATPDAEAAQQVQLPEVKGPVPSVQPWVRYEFVDPKLESLTSGQKIMLRMGPANEAKLKAKLSELRGEILKRTKKR
ncbi:MAG TPA: DUF3014 domain-containing protein [Burkholderiaceae bacterium]|nr:DUF3014 domain-containing protein [Burkholderiaceae bacterium]